MRQGVAWHNWPAKARVVNAAEEYELLLAVFDLAQRQYCATLCQCFYDKHARHDRRAWKVALKEGFVDCYLLNANDSLKRDKLNDPINEQKWVAVWQVLLNSTSVENRFHKKIGCRG